MSRNTRPLEISVTNPCTETVEAKCMRCSSKYMNKLGWKFGVCPSCKGKRVDEVDEFAAGGVDYGIDADYGEYSGEA